MSQHESVEQSSYWVDEQWAALETELLGTPVASKALMHLTRYELENGLGYFERMRSGGHDMQLFIGNYDRANKPVGSAYRVIINRTGKDIEGPFILVSDYVVDRQTGELWNKLTTIRQYPDSPHWDKLTRGAPLIHNNTGVDRPEVYWNLNHHYEQDWRAEVEQRPANSNDSQFLADINPDVVLSPESPIVSVRTYAGATAVHHA